MRLELPGGYELDDERARLKWLLHAADMHELYRTLGFGPPHERLMARPSA